MTARKTTKEVLMQNLFNPFFSLCKTKALNVVSKQNKERKNKQK